jgi:hypothetical protein
VPHPSRVCFLGRVGFFGPAFDFVFAVHRPFAAAFFDTKFPELRRTGSPSAGTSQYQYQTLAPNGPCGHYETVSFRNSVLERG